MRQCFVLLLSLDEIGISIVYRCTSDKSVVRIASRSMSSTILVQRLARASFFKVALVLSS